MNVQLFNYHTAGTQVRTCPTSGNPVTSQTEASGSTNSKVICYSWNVGCYIAVDSIMHVAGGGDHRATSCTSLQSARPHSPDPEEPERWKRH